MLLIFFVFCDLSLDFFHQTAKLAPQPQVRLGEAGASGEVVAPGVARAGHDRAPSALPRPGREVGALMAAGELDVQVALDGDVARASVMA